MRQWHNLLKETLANGVTRPGRMGVDTIATFGQSIQFDMRSGFPAVTTKKLAFKTMCAELECFLKGSTNVADFHAAGCHIWDGNLTAAPWNNKYGNGELGPIYGAQWRNWNGIDQLQVLVDGMKSDPFSRRHLVTALNPGADVCLPPCHIFFQCFVYPDWSFDLQVYMRSVDLFLGLPFDIASYGVLQHLIGLDTNLRPNKLLFSFGDAHIYSNHIEQVEEALNRSIKPLPSLIIEPAASINNFTSSMATLHEYEYHPAIQAKLNT